MTEQEWWATAPEWAKWHTWDRGGKTWWETKPKFYTDKDGGRWVVMARWNETNGEYLWYDAETPCPIEIDPAKTLRKRPKEAA
jgi:hypothetical protein